MPDEISDEITPLHLDDYSCCTDEESVAHEISCNFSEPYTDYDGRAAYAECPGEAVWVIETSSGTSFGACARDGHLADLVIEAGNGASVRPLVPNPPASSSEDDDPEIVERARRSVRRFREMQPGLSAFARMMTKRSARYAVISAGDDEHVAEIGSRRYVNLIVELAAEHGQDNVRVTPAESMPEVTARDVRDVIESAWNVVRPHHDFTVRLSFREPGVTREQAHGILEAGVNVAFENSDYADEIDLYGWNVQQ
jgi:hypothetical protein